MKIAHLIEKHRTRVVNWDDRTSPEDWPEALLITADELDDLLREFAADVLREAAGALTVEANRHAPAD